MGLGFAGLVSGIIIDVNHADDNFYSTFTSGKTNNTGTIIAIAGGCMMVGTIPLFIASAKNKRKANAATTFFKMETVPVIKQHSFVQHTFPAVSIKINL